MYLKRTEPRGSQVERIFISFKQDQAPEVAASTISRWIKDTVVLAYSSVGRDVGLFHTVRAHEVRSLSASLAKHPL